MMQNRNSAHAGYHERIVEGRLLLCLHVIHHV